MTLHADEPRDVRDGAEIDVHKLSRWIARNVRGWPETELKVRQFPGGFSNLTYLLSAGGHEAVLRRPPFGSRSGTAHDMAREYRVISALDSAGVPAPAPIALCDDEEVLGAPFYLMERVHGVILRAPPAPPVSIDAMRALSERFVSTLASIHAVPIDAPGIAELSKGSGYVERQVAGWTKRYLAAQTDEIADMTALATWLEANRPPDSGATLIHNDYKYDNLVLDPDSLEVLAVLDWEMATVGDPLMDLGTALAYWVQPNDPPAILSLGIGATMAPGNFTRGELAVEYARLSGRSIDRLPFYHAFGLFKVAVIAQQIYARYEAGFAKDPRFAGLIHGVRALAAAGVQASQGATLPG